MLKGWEPTEVLALVGLIIGPIAALVGFLVQSQLQGRLNRRQWEYNTRKETYIKLFLAGERVRRRLLQLYVEKKRAEEDTDFLEAEEEFTVALWTSLLLASERVEREANRWLMHLVAYQVLVNDLNDTDRESKIAKADEKALRARQAFIVAARKDLGLKAPLGISKEDAQTWHETFDPSA